MEQEARRPDGAGTARAMLEQLRGSGRRFAAVSVLAVALIATAVSVTIWRYEAALSRSAVALDARSDAALTETLSSDFWHEREAMNEYFLAPSPAILTEVSTPTMRSL